MLPHFTAKALKKETVDKVMKKVRKTSSNFSGPREKPQTMKNYCRFFSNINAP